MTQKITVKPNQSVLDIVLQACGSLEGAMQIMAQNERSISQNPEIGSQYEIPAEVTTDKNTLNYIRQNGVRIGTRSPA